MVSGVPAVVRGGGELASAAARLLFLAGMRVVVLEREQPLAVRRLVSYGDAVFRGERDVEGVRGVLVAMDAVLDEATPFIPVVIDPQGTLLARSGVEVVIDARMSKRGAAPRTDSRAFLVGLGPGFTAGEDVDAVVETQRGPDLGRVIWSGAAEPDTSLPSPVLGFTEKRVLRAPRSGVYRERIAIGAVVMPGDVVGEIGGEPVATRIAGLLRGVLQDGVHIAEGAKVGDVDPRGPGVNAAAVSDKARAVAAGVLEAVLMRRRGLR
jgi:xanthine dehydrogenase accessory factor